MFGLQWAAAVGSVPEYEVTVTPDPARAVIPLTGLTTDVAVTWALPEPAVCGSVVPSGPITAIELVVAVLSGSTPPVF